MFVLHPSSRCDVCLEGFSWETEMAPFAIPCGHVFCKTCLEAVIPPKCPLCRKNYDPTRLKKLHVDRPEGMDDPKEGEFLQRIALSFDAPEDHLQELVEELDAWLREKDPESCLPVRKARMALDKYQELRFMGIESKREISRLRQDLTELRQVMAAEKDQASLIERRLLEEKDGLEIQLDSYRTELEQLRSEIHRRTLKNPLPPPPQPVSFARYPPFDPKFNQGTARWYNDSGQSMLMPTKYPPNGLAYVRPWMDDERENQHHVLNESNGARRDRKGKASDPNSELYRSVYVANPAAAASTSSNGVPSTSQLETPRTKPGIIPGASAASGFMPPDPENEKERGFHAYRTPESSPSRRSKTPKPLFDPARDAVDPYTLTAALLPEYVNGYTEGFSSALQTVQNATASGSRSSKEPEASTSASGSGSASASSSTQPDERTERRERRRREREKEREKEREGRRDRERDRERERERRERRRERPSDEDREGGDRERDRERERERRRERQHRKPTSENLADAIAAISSAETRRSRRDRDRERERDRDREREEGPSSSNRERQRRRRTSDADAAQRTQAQAQATLASILSDNPSRARRSSTARPATSAPQIDSQPTIVPNNPQPNPPALPAPTQSTVPLAQPTPRLPAQPPPMPPPEPQPTVGGEPLLATPASRHSFQSDASASSWGTVSSGPNPNDATPNSFASLNLRTFSRYPAQALNAGQSLANGNANPQRSPQRAHFAQQEGEEESSSSEEESDDEQEDPSPVVIQPAPNGRHHPSRNNSHTNVATLVAPVPTRPETASNLINHSQHRQQRTPYQMSASAAPTAPSYPTSAPAHGSRHTQAMTVSNHYQNPTLPYQNQGSRPTSVAVSSGSAGESHGRSHRHQQVQPQPQLQRSQHETGRHRGHSHSHSHPPPQPQPHIAHPLSHQTNHLVQLNVYTNGHVNGPNVKGDPRPRRLSSAAPPDVMVSAVSSLSSLSLHSLRAPPPNSAPVNWPSTNQPESSSSEEDDDDEEDSSSEEEGQVVGQNQGLPPDTAHTGNALGLAIPPNWAVGAQRPDGQIPISAPAPRVSSRAFLRSFSHEDYA